MLTRHDDPAYAAMPRAHSHQTNDTMRVLVSCNAALRKQTILKDGLGGPLG